MAKAKATESGATATASPASATPVESASVSVTAARGGAGAPAASASSTGRGGSGLFDGLRQARCACPYCGRPTSNKSALSRHFLSCARRKEMDQKRQEGYSTPGQHAQHHTAAKFASPPHISPENHHVMMTTQKSRRDHDDGHKPDTTLRSRSQMLRSNKGSATATPKQPLQQRQNRLARVEHSPYSRIAAGSL